jgi:hypothetical protein
MENRKRKKMMFEIVVSVPEVLQGLKVATYYVGEARKDAAGGTAARLMAATRFQASDDDDTLLGDYADAAAWEMAACLPDTLLTKEEGVYRYSVHVPPTFLSQWAEALRQGVKRGIALFVLYQWYAHRDEATATGYLAEYEMVRTKLLYDVARRLP